MRPAPLLGVILPYNAEAVKRNGGVLATKGERLDVVCQTDDVPEALVEVAGDRHRLEGVLHVTVLDEKHAVGHNRELAAAYARVEDP